MQLRNAQKPQFVSPPKHQQHRQHQQHSKFHLRRRHHRLLKWNTLFILTLQLRTL